MGLKLGFNTGGGGDGPIRDTRVLSLKSSFPSSPPKKKDLDNPNKRHQDCIAINAHIKTSVHKCQSVSLSTLSNILECAFLVKMKRAAVVPLLVLLKILLDTSWQALIAHQPSIYVLETPGVLVPSILDIETEPKLAFAVLNTQGTPLHWKHLNSRRLEGIQYDSKEKHEYNLKDLQPKRLQPKRTKPPNDSDMLYIELI
nr:short integuments 2, mitochondrial-like [Quercus suber]